MFTGNVVLTTELPRLRMAAMPAARSGAGGVALDGSVHLVAAWWLFVGCVGLVSVLFSHHILPPKFNYDGLTIREYMAARDLWIGWTFDGWVNIARVWDLVFRVLPEGVAIGGYYLMLVVMAMLFLNVFAVRNMTYQLLAGGWLLCASLFFAPPSKEMVALPVALFLCLARSLGAKVLATAVFIAYAAFFRQYWAICYFYFACGLLALRLHVSGRSGVAACLLLVAYVLPFAAVQWFDLAPLTDARLMINESRLDSPDARSAFGNLLENTGLWTDVANAMGLWIFMIVPLAMLLDPTPHYVAFAAFQLATLWFFMTGLLTYLREAVRWRYLGSTYPRCIAFVAAYSLTQGLFEPDFGSFLRHEMVIMLPFLIVAFCRAHAQQRLPRGTRYPTRTYTA